MAGARIGQGWMALKQDCQLAGPFRRVKRQGVSSKPVFRANCRAERRARGLLFPRFKDLKKSALREKNDMPGFFREISGHFPSDANAAWMPENGMAQHGS
jgi:hypothetical protein